MVPNLRNEDAREGAGQCRSQLVVQGEPPSTVKIFSCEETVELVVASVPDAKMPTERSTGREEESAVVEKPFILRQYASVLFCASANAPTSAEF